MGVRGYKRSHFQQECFWWPNGKKPCAGSWSLSLRGYIYYRGGRFPHPTISEAVFLFDINRLRRDGGPFHPHPPPSRTKIPRIVPSRKSPESKKPPEGGSQNWWGCAGGSPAGPLE